MSLYLDIYHGGVRSYEFLGLTLTKNKIQNQNSMNLAEAIRAKRQLELSGESHGVPVSGKGRMPAVTYLEHYLKNFHRKDKRVFSAMLNHFKVFAGENGITTLSTLTDKKALLFRNWLGERLGGETPFNYFKVFKKALKEAAQSGLIARSPAESVVNPNPTSGTLRKAALEPHEIAAMVNARCGSDEVRRAFLFACNTGLRAIDITRLDWKDIDPKSRTLKFTQSKTGRTNTVPLNDMAMDILSRSGKGNVFNLPSMSAVNKDLKVWKERAGITKHVTFHVARHSFVSNILRATGNLKLAGSLAGHSSTKETEKYAHLIDSEKRSAVEKL